MQGAQPFDNLSTKRVTTHWSSHFEMKMILIGNDILCLMLYDTAFMQTRFRHLASSKRNFAKNLPNG